MRYVLFMFLFGFGLCFATVEYAIHFGKDIEEAMKISGVVVLSAIILNILFVIKKEDL